MYVCLHVKYPSFFTDLNETRFSSTYFRNFSKTKYHKNLSSGNRVFEADGQRDEHDKAYIRYDVNNQQDATTFPFINLLKSALHVSGKNLAHSQEHFRTVYTAFGIMHRYCCRPVPRLRWNSIPSQPWHRSPAVSVHCTKDCIYSQKVLLRMGEFVARNTE